MQHVENDLDTTIEKLSQTNQSTTRRTSSTSWQRARHRLSTGNWSFWRTSYRGQSRSWPPPQQSSARHPPGQMTSTKPSKSWKPKT